MSFLLDTDTCSAYLKNVRAVSNRFLQHGGLHISVVTVTQLEIWLLRRRVAKRRKQAYQAMRRMVDVLALDRMIAELAGDVGARLYDQGLPMETMDLLIAATALSHNMTLVTHNTSDFINVPGLTMTDWMTP